MGTRGSITFVSEGVERTVYNHFDSYPDGLGMAVLEFVRGMVDEGASDRRRQQVANMTPVEGEEWYEKLRDTQGDPDAILDAGFFEDAADFPLDSLFCEWAYVIDLDHQVLEVHQGFQERSHQHGRFASRSSSGQGRTAGAYYPVKLLASWGFGSLPAASEMSSLE